MPAGKYKSFCIFSRPTAISIRGTLTSTFVSLAEKYKSFTRPAAILDIWGTFCVRKEYAYVNYAYL